ncbi:MAG: hypothetical protein WDO24_06245 [Pseudomonadota bacterium]
MESPGGNGTERALGAAIAAAYRADETTIVERLLGTITLDDAARDRIAARAGALIAGVRARAAGGRRGREIPAGIPAVDP